MLKRFIFVFSALLLALLQVAAATSGEAATAARVYDLEHHYYLPEFIEHLSTRQSYPSFDKETGVLTYHKGAFLPYYHPSYISERVRMLDLIENLGDLRLKAMDEAGVTMAVVSSSPVIEALPKEEAVKYARLTNDAVAEACRKYPGRFAGTITLPTPYVEEAIAELNRAVNELGLQYVHTHSNYGSEEDNLSQDKYIPLLAECERLNVPIYIHPHNPTCQYLTEYGSMFSAAGFGFGVDTMRTSLRLILNGRLDQFPRLKIILGHMGEFYPYLLERMDNRFFCMQDEEVKCAHNFTYYFQNKNIFVTTSGIHDPEVVLFAIKKLGVDSIMFGSDFPYEEFKDSVDFVKSLPLSDEDKEKILYRNAEEYILRK